MAFWRQLDLQDIESLIRVADTIHPGLPERSEVFAERVRLFPEGCLALIEERSNGICGDAISYPIRHLEPPPLDTLIGGIAPDADRYYVHDLAILPEFQGRGFGRQGVTKLLEVARHFPAVCLISVYGTQPFWGRFEFIPAKINDALKENLLRYGEDASFLERDQEKGFS